MVTGIRSLGVGSGLNVGVWFADWTADGRAPVGTDRPVGDNHYISLTDKERKSILDDEEKLCPRRAVLWWWVAVRSAPEPMCIMQAREIMGVLHGFGWDSQIMYFSKIG